MIERMTGGKMFKIDLVKKYSTNYTTCTEEAQKALLSFLHWLRQAQP
jgi:hypothetical protein